MVGMLLERDHVLAEIDTLAQAAAEGAGKVVFVIGEAGIGKTSVLRAARERTDAVLRPVWTACEDVSSPEALTVLRELPEIDGDLLNNAHDGGSRLSLFRDTLERLSQTPTILFVEDLHWADDGSIDFIRYAGRRIEGLPLLLVISSRNEEQSARSRIVRAAGDLPPSSRCRFDLDRLSSMAVGQLAAAQGKIGSSIHEMTDGNPLLVTELLANSGSRTHTIDELVVGRASLLPNEARAFLDYCSIIPRRVSIEQIEASGASDEHVQTCIDCGLLLPDGDGIAFRHELTRHAIEASLTPLRRRQLHSGELERLDRIGASAARRLHHAISSGNRARIEELAPIAAEQAARLGAHGEAAQAWGAMLSANDPPDDPLPCERYAFELHMFGELPQAIWWQKHALSLHIKARDQRRRGDCLRFLSRLHYLNGERAAADRNVAEAVATLEPLGGSPELALAYATAAQLKMLDDSNSEAIRWSELALAIAEDLGREDILSTTLINYGTALQFSDFERAVETLDHSIELGKRSGADEHVARAYINKGWMYLSRPSYAEAVPIFREGIEFCREHDLVNFPLYMRGGVALSLLSLGQWDEALEEASAVLAQPANTALTGNPSIRALATLLIRRGTTGADELIARLRDHDMQGRETPRFNSYAKIVAEQAWTRGEGVAEARDVLREAFGQLRPDGRPWDAAGLWFWNRKLGVPLPPPADMPTPFALFAAGDVEAAAAAMRELGLCFNEALILVEGSADQAARGLAILDQLGAEATAARVRADLLERGIRKGTRGPRATTRGNQHGLTKRELDVLRWIDSGMSNKEIAGKLFVSPKTVDHHVSAILAKTETKTRGEAAALARRDSLLE